MKFDYLLWLIGDAKTVACQYTNSGAFEIETEDVCEVMLTFQKWCYRHHSPRLLAAKISYEIV